MLSWVLFQLFDCALGPRGVIILLGLNFSIEKYFAFVPLVKYSILFWFWFIEPLATYVQVHVKNSINLFSSCYAYSVFVTLVVTRIFQLVTLSPY